MRSYALLFAAAALAACQKAETTEQAAARIAAESDSARTAIEAANTTMARYINTGHADSMAMLYTENGTMMSPGAPAVAGRDSILAYNTRNPMAPGASLALHTTAVVANGPLAVEHGTFTFSMPAMGRTPAFTSSGKYMAHWHRMNGTWKLAANIWNDDAAMPPAPPAR